MVLRENGSVEKHILLLKLSEALDHAPEFGEKPTLDVATPQRQWLSTVSALLSRLGLEKKFAYQSAFSTLAKGYKPAANTIKGQVADAIEELKLDLEIDGRSEVGSAYAPGDVYRFYADLKAIISKAQTEVMIIDPYFDGKTFDAYLSEIKSGISIKLLASKHAVEVQTYAHKHSSQFKTNIETRRSNDTHDRLVLVDQSDCWIVGASIKDAAGKKPTYLIPLDPEIAALKLTLYTDIWTQSKPVT